MTRTQHSQHFGLLEITPKPYKSFSDFVVRHNAKNVYNKRPDVKIACPNCGGYGRVYNPKDRDPIEGYKLADRVICNECLGSGEWNRDEAKKSYTNAITAWKKLHEEEVQYRRRQLMVLKKLRNTFSVTERRILHQMVVQHG